MDTLNRLRSYLKREKGLPWEYGCCPEELSGAAAKAWEVLGIEERLIISRHSPFRGARRLKLVELRRQGLTQMDLCALSGFKIGGIARLKIGGKERGE